MPRGKRDIRGRKHLHNSSPLGQNGNMEAAKVTMSTAGKNQNINNNRWAKTIEMYHDDLTGHE